ncbi:hypothetical protein N182_28085 [Sinorhizobium sp. GL2]|nr:hypothetical protein N182_28085 [Sinorhizobium sp. GL2]
MVENRILRVALDWGGARASIRHVSAAGGIRGGLYSIRMGVSSKTISAHHPKLRMHRPQAPDHHAI